jgi:hypothetical protein
MQFRTLLATGVLAVSLAAFASAKSWDITIDSSAKVGNVMLPAGSYTVKLQNDQALFTSDSGKKFTVTVKVQANATPKKYEQTEMRTQKQGDTNVIQAIELGGTTQELEFGE